MSERGRYEGSKIRSSRSNEMVRRTQDFKQGENENDEHSNKDEHGRGGMRQRAGNGKNKIRSSRCK